MPRYHINNNGQAGVCRALRVCPFGDRDKDHYDSPEEARADYEARMASQTFPTSVESPVRRNPSSTGPSTPRSDSGLGTLRDSVTPDSNDDEAELRRKQKLAQNLVREGDAQSAVEAMEAALELEKEIIKLKANKIELTPRVATANEKSILDYSKLNFKEVKRPRAA